MSGPYQQQARVPEQGTAPAWNPE
ncbi:MAG: hypothetical protein QOE23_2693, partial [Pseudonocardiales bacterium]|nr:hypothetical protein [Pseudonocardiales bacterium]